LGFGAGSRKRFQERVVMGPDVALDAGDLRTNALAWRERAGVPLRAVVKANGYGWGVDALVEALDRTVDGYYVSDAEEFGAVRRLTVKPIATLGNIADADLPRLLDGGGIPTISTTEGIEVAGAWSRASGRRARVRIALRNATGWAGVTIDEIATIASAAARARIDVELSTHVTDASLRDRQVAEFVSARRLLQDLGVTVVASDVASTAPLALGPSEACSHVRVGLGLFGARFGANVGVVSALRVCAPIVERDRAHGQRTGYGLHRAPKEGYVAVVRCGYGDGFPPLRDRHIGVLAVGMQFTTVYSCEAFAKDSLALIDRNTDLDALARASRIGPHQLVVALGNAACAARVIRPPLQAPHAGP
jgi:alanine racemase